MAGSLFGIHGVALELRSQRMGLIVLARQHHHLDVRVRVEQGLQQAKPLRNGVRVRRQAQVHCHHRGLMAAELDQRALAIAGHDGLEALDRPLDLLLQRQVVFDDQQRRRVAVAHGRTPRPAAGPAKRE